MINSEGKSLSSKPTAFGESSIAPLSAPPKEFKCSRVSFAPFSEKESPPLTNMGGSRRDALKVRKKDFSSRLIGLTAHPSSDSVQVLSSSSPSSFLHQHEKEEMKPHQKTLTTRQFPGLGLSMKSHFKRQRKYRIAQVHHTTKRTVEENSSRTPPTRKPSTAEEKSSTKSKGFWELLVKSLDEERVNVSKEDRILKKQSEAKAR